MFRLEYTETRLVIKNEKTAENVPNFGHISKKFRPFVCLDTYSDLYNNYIPRTPGL